MPDEHTLAIIQARLARLPTRGYLCRMLLWATATIRVLLGALGAIASAVIGKASQPARGGLCAKILLLLGFVAAFGLIGAIGFYLQTFGWLG